jgi:hypothetical protein
MRKVFFLLACLLLISSVADAQIRRKRIRRNYQSRMQRIGEISYLGSAGISSYFGDLKQSINLWAKPTAGAGVQYRFDRHFQLRGEILWYRISGADSLNDPDNTIYDRNLSFRADNFEGSVTVVGYLYNKYSRVNKPILNPYAFAGLGFTTNNPKAYYQGEWHRLRPLETENVSYSGILLAVPFGIGLTYHDVVPRLDLSAEFGYRYTLSDYMDDASTVYPDRSSLNSTLAQALSDRRDEFRQREGREPRYTGSNYRGNPGNNDWYMISAVKVIYTPGIPARRKYRRAKF